MGGVDQIITVIPTVDKDKKYLFNCIKSIVKSAEYAKITVNFIIIANATIIDNLDLPKLIKYKSINNEKNIGFGQSINQALKIARTKWCIIACPDTVTSKSCIKKLLNHVKRDGVALLAPRIISENNKLEHTILSKSTLKDIFLEQSYLYKILPTLLHHPLSDQTQYRQFRYARNVAAIWWLINRELFINLGGFDRRYFLYFEDVDFCNKLNKYYSIGYEPKATVVHLKHKSNEGIMLADKYVDSIYKYLLKNHSIIYAKMGIIMLMLGTIFRYFYWNIYKNLLSEYDLQYVNNKIIYLKGLIYYTSRIILCSKSS